MVQGWVQAKLLRWRLPKVFPQNWSAFETTTVRLPKQNPWLRGYDVVICSKALIDVFDGLDLPNTKVIGLQNLLSEKSLRSWLKTALVP